MMLTGSVRDEVARILEIVAKDGLPGPRDLDVALDAIGCAIDKPDTEDQVDDDADFEWIGDKLVSLPTWTRNDEATLMRLLLAAIDVPREIIGQWTDDECRDADVWAVSTHYLASDNDVIVPPMPPHVRKYFGGGK